MAVDEQLVAFTRRRAAELSGLSQRQLNYWRTTSLIEPSTSAQISEHREVHLYTFADMLELLVIADLIEHRVPTRRVRKIVNRLRTQHGYERPLTEARWGVVGPAGRRERIAVFVKLPDGTTEGDDVPGQIVAEGTVDMVEMRARIHRGVRRAQEAVGRVERRRGAVGGVEVFTGTRIPVATVRAFIVEGTSDRDILEAFPALKVEDIEAVRTAS